MLLSDHESFHLHHGDCIEHMATLPDACFDMSVFSPPFPALYAYTNSEADIGNSEDLRGETKLHLSFFYRQLARLIKPGRVCMVHVAQIPRMKRSGGVGLFDFRGFNIRLAERAGLVFEFDWVVRKNPQSQAIRTKSRELQFSGLESDRAKSRGCLSDYLLKFRAPGENAVPVRDYEIITDDCGDNRSDVNRCETQVARNEWIDWAEGTWSDIRETDTLNVSEGRAINDTKHICPLQLQVIERLIRLYTNPDEIVFSPFAGIGSELYTALKFGRRAYGCELKDEYIAAAQRNCERAIRKREEANRGLFDAVGNSSSQEESGVACLS